MGREVGRALSGGGICTVAQFRGPAPWAPAGLDTETALPVLQRDSQLLLNPLRNNNLNSTITSEHVRQGTAALRRRYSSVLLVAMLERSLPGQ